jgi:hypothetical protein
MFFRLLIQAQFVVLLVVCGVKMSHGMDESSRDTSFGISRGQLEAQYGVGAAEDSNFERGGYKVSFLRAGQWNVAFINDRILYYERKIEQRVSTVQEAEKLYPGGVFIVRGSRIYEHLYASLELLLHGICGTEPVYSGGANGENRILKSHLIFESSHVEEFVYDSKACSDFCKEKAVGHYVLVKIDSPPEDQSLGGFLP